MPRIGQVRVEVVKVGIIQRVRDESLGGAGLGDVLVVPPVSREDEGAQALHGHKGFPGTGVPRYNQNDLSAIGLLVFDGVRDVLHAGRLLVRQREELLPAHERPEGLSQCVRQIAPARVDVRQRLPFVSGPDEPPDKIEELPLLTLAKGRSGLRVYGVGGGVDHIPAHAVVEQGAGMDHDGAFPDSLLGG